MRLQLTADGLLTISQGTLDARRVGHLIDALGRCRQAMAPAVPLTVDPVTLAPIHAPGMFVGLRPNRALTIAFRHPGLGWLPFELPRETVAELREFVG